MKTKLLLGLIVVAAIAFGFWFLNSAKEENQAPLSQTETQTPTPAAETAQPSFTRQTFENVKSAHYVSSSPKNNQLLTAPINSVSLKFNFDLAPPSKIKVTRDGTDVTTGATQIAGDKLTLSVPINGSQTGNYAVTYTACWPDKSCHNGSFGFSIQLP